MRACAMVVVVGGVSGAAFGQAPAMNGRFEFEFDRLVVSPQNPGVTLTVYAAWDEVNLNDWLLGVADYDLAASDARFTSALLILGRNPPNDPGMVNGSRVEGARIGQIVIPGISCKFGCPFPAPLAEYTWVATDFTPRAVSFESENTTQFVLVSSFSGASTNLLGLGEFTPGFGAITVVPAPAGVAVLVGAGAVCIRRRRR